MPKSLVATWWKPTEIWAAKITLHVDSHVAR